MVVILPGWPPNSPFLNPIEVILSIVNISPKCSVNTVEYLRCRVRQICNNIPTDFIDKLVKSFRSRLEMCLKIRGKYIYVNICTAHRKEVKEEDIVRHEEINLFPEAQDSLILKSGGRFMAKTIGQNRGVQA